MDILSTSYISSLVTSYKTEQQSTSIDPLTTRKTKYSNLSTGYSTLSTKLTALKSVLSDLKLTDADSIFRTKSATSSDDKFLTATASSTASASAYDLRISQLAKSDILLSSDVDSATANSIAGTHTFVIKGGDGESGEYYSKVSVTFGSSETNETAMEKIRDAINSDKAVVNSNEKSSSDSFAGGPGSIKININGTEETVNYNGGGTYSDLMDELVTNINNNVAGVSAEKVTDGSNVSLKITVTDPTKYITISQNSGNDIVNDLGINVTKEKGAAGIVTASVVTPQTGSSQFTLTAKNTGLNYRITSLTDDSGSSALASLGLNLGTDRPAFSQLDGADTAGYMYVDTNYSTNLLNSKFVLNGLNLQRNSNSVTDAVDGMTFVLKSNMQDSDTTVNVKVQYDTTTIKSKLQSFIDKFNDVYTYLKTNTAASSDGTRGLYSGDNNAASLISALSSLTYSKVSGISSNELTMLTQIGINFSTTDGLSISDSSKLENAINTNSSQIENLFNSTNGIANKLYNTVNPYLGSSGYLKKSQSNFDSSITYLSDRITATQNRIDKAAELLRSQYEQLQIQLSTLMSTQNMLGLTSSSDTSSSSSS